MPCSLASPHLPPTGQTILSTSNKLLLTATIKNKCEYDHGKTINVITTIITVLIRAYSSSIAQPYSRPYMDVYNPSADKPHKCSQLRKGFTSKLYSRLQVRAAARNLKPKTYTDPVCHSCWVCVLHFYRA